MSFVVRTASLADLRWLYEMAKLAGTGITNLPPDRDTLAAKLERCEAACTRTDGGVEDDLFVLVLEDLEAGEVRGTAQLFCCVGKAWPFYSYRIVRLTQHSRELGRTVTAEMLSLVNDLGGASEVGGLFLHPLARAGGLGLLLARSRYLFIAMHKERFGERVLAELRGVIDESGASPFWDAIGGRFFGMSFPQADQFNAMNGNQFIADLMPKHPVYTALLGEEARRVIGVPHPSGRPAMRMLEREGFVYEGYVDIFDGGPTVTARTDAIASVRAARPQQLAGLCGEEGEEALLATGRLERFRCCLGRRLIDGDLAAIDPASAAALGVGVGDEVWSVAR